MGRGRSEQREKQTGGQTNIGRNRQIEGEGEAASQPDRQMGRQEVGDGM